MQPWAGWALGLHATSGIMGRKPDGQGSSFPAKGGGNVQKPTERVNHFPLRSGAEIPLKNRGVEGCRRVLGLSLMTGLEQVFCTGSVWHWRGAALGRMQMGGRWHRCRSQRCDWAGEAGWGGVWGGDCRAGWACGGEVGQGICVARCDAWGRRGRMTEVLRYFGGGLPGCMSVPCRLPAPAWAFLAGLSSWPGLSSRLPVYPFRVLCLVPFPVLPCPLPSNLVRCPFPLPCC